MEEFGQRFTVHTETCLCITDSLSNTTYVETNKRTSNQFIGLTLLYSSPQTERTTDFSALGFGVPLCIWSRKSFEAAYENFRILIVLSYHLAHNSWCVRVTWV